jgi:glycosyltransferase involved in cell wall biosynthesis
MKFSIITCTLNSERFIKDNIKSVEKQEFQDYEHIFIDGNSTDKTLEIIKEYQVRNKERVKIYRADPKGIANAMNVGIVKSHGEFLIHLHSDDQFFDKRVLGDIANFLRNNQCDWIFGKEQHIRENGDEICICFNNRLFHQSSDEPWGKTILNFVNYIRHQTVFIKRDVFNKFGFFDETIKTPIDIDFWFRIKDKTKWKYFDRVISKFRVHESSRSSGKKFANENKKEVAFVYKKYLNNYEFFLWNVVKLASKTPWLSSVVVKNIARIYYIIKQ